MGQRTDAPPKGKKNILPLVLLAIMTGPGDARGQAVCAVGSLNSTACTAPTPITVSTASGIGLNGSGAAVLITANGITLDLGAANAVGVLVQNDSDARFDSNTLRTISIGAAASGQIGLRATDTGSSISATGSAITLVAASGNSSNIIAAMADAGATLTLNATTISTGGGANGANNTGLLSSGAGSLITMAGGAVSTSARGSIGAIAQAGGSIVMNGGANLATTGAQIVAGSIGSHALLATGTGSQITGTGITLNTAGLFASGARAENGGAISLTGSTISTTSTAAADLDPSSAARALSGGAIHLTDSTIITTGQRGNGFSVQDSGSQAIISDSSISTSGTRAPGGLIFDGGQATITSSSFLSSGNTGLVVQDAGSTATLTNSTIRSTAPVGYGVKVILGGSATLTGGSSATEGRDGPALYTSNGTITATDVALTTSGPDNAMGALADLNGRITLTGGSITTSGDAVRISSFPHGIAARNPGGTLIASGTSVLTTGIVAMGGVADDGGSLLLSGNSITTSGPGSLGLYATVEQAGPQFPATITGDGLTVETSGLGAHGVFANQHFLIAPSVASLTRSSVTTHGDLAAGLRAIGAGTVNGDSSTVRTEGATSHGLHARDNGSSINLSAADVSTAGAFAHGALAEGGGLVTGIDARVDATGASASALYVAGAPGFVSNANFLASQLTNTSGPTIGIGGHGNVRLTGSSASGSGQWLHAGTISDFPPLAAPDAGPGGVTDPERLESAPVFGAPAALPVAPGYANVLVDDSTVEGSAFTAPGSVSNVILANNSLWNMTGSSNLTNLVNDPSMIQFSPPVGDPQLAASYKTLTVVNYIGESGGIGLHTYLGSDGSPSDRLVIDGGTATGHSPLHIANTIGPGALTTGNGIEVVSAINGATTAPGAFSLGNIVAAGPYEYLLFHGGVTPGAENNWFLRNVTGPVPPEPPCLDVTGLGVCPPPQPPAPPAPPPPRPYYRMEAPLYSKITLLARQMGLLLLGTFHERQGDQYLLTRDRGAIWARVIGAGIKQKFTGPLVPSFEGTAVGAQIGGDAYVSDDGKDRVGLFASYAYVDGTVRGTILDDDDEVGGQLPEDVITLGGTYTHIGDNGWYLDGVLMGTWFNAYPVSERGIHLHTTGSGITASAEGAYPFALDETWTLEPMAQIVFTSMGFESSSDPYTTLDFQPADAWHGRIGARLEDDTTLDGKPAKPYLELNLWHGFGGTDVTVYNSNIPVAIPFGNTDMQFAIGITSQVEDNASLIARVSHLISISGNYHRATAGHIGLRYAL